MHISLSQKVLAPERWLTYQHFNSDFETDSYRYAAYGLCIGKVSCEFVINVPLWEFESHWLPVLCYIRPANNFFNRQIFSSRASVQISARIHTPVNVIISFKILQILFVTNDKDLGIGGLVKQNEYHVWMGKTVQNITRSPMCVTEIYWMKPKITT